MLKRWKKLKDQLLHDWLNKIPINIYILHLIQFNKNKVKICNCLINLLKVIYQSSVWLYAF